MEVILLERVEKLGHIGDVVHVKNGFARNYLLPNKKALRGNVEGTKVQLIRQASNVGHLFGSVSARDIVEALAAAGAHVTRSQVVLDRPIKTIGMHDVKIALHPEVAVTVHVNVARSPEEAELQAQGVDVIQAMFEEQAAPIAAEALAGEPEGEEAAAEEASADEAAAEDASADEAAPAEEAEQPESDAE